MEAVTVIFVSTIDIMALLITLWLDYKKNKIEINEKVTKVDDD